MNKKGIRFKFGMFAIIAISVMVLAFGTIIDEQADKYGTAAVSEITDFDKLDEVSSTARGYEGSLTPEDPEPGEDAETGTFRGVYGIIALAPDPHSIRREGSIVWLLNVELNNVCPSVSVKAISQ